VCGARERHEGRCGGTRESGTLAPARGRCPSHCSPLSCPPGANERARYSPGWGGRRNSSRCGSTSRKSGDSRARRGRYTRAQISTPSQLPAGETGANQERVPRVQGEKSLRRARVETGPHPGLGNLLDLGRVKEIAAVYAIVRWAGPISPSYLSNTSRGGERRPEGSGCRPSRSCSRVRRT
jgi:hypothetical protein